MEEDNASTRCPSPLPPTIGWSSEKSSDQEPAMRHTPSAPPRLQVVKPQHPPKIRQLDLQAPQNEPNQQFPRSPGSLVLPLPPLPMEACQSASSSTSSLFAAPRAQSHGSSNNNNNSNSNSNNGGINDSNSSCNGNSSNLIGRSSAMVGAHSVPAPGAGVGSFPLHAKCALPRVGAGAGSAVPVLLGAEGAADQASKIMLPGCFLGGGVNRPSLAPLAGQKMAVRRLSAC
mmetsp:Transcript_76903/g.159999  ORF Transcript_76903/g.159999 Transcript_76903/m.159999 type:complete len:230 (+) Transcript_76903:2-691(+)